MSSVAIPATATIHGRRLVDFAADDADDLHEVAITAPYLDIRVCAPGAPGPRHVARTAGEWTAIARTARGGSVRLAARSLHAGTAHLLAASLAIADLDASTLVFSGVPVGKQQSLG